MNPWLDHIQILCGGCLAISDDLINCWEKSIKNKVAHERHFEKMPPKNLVGAIYWIAFKFDPLVL